MKLTDLTTADLRRLATSAGTSLKYLQHVVATRRQPSVRMAIKLEAAAARLGWTLGRETMVQECKTCPYMRACRKGKT